MDVEWTNGILSLAYWVFFFVCLFWLLYHIKSLIKWTLFVSPLHGWRLWGFELLKNLPKVTLPERSRGRTQIQSLIPIALNTKLYCPAKGETPDGFRARGGRVVFYWHSMFLSGFFLEIDFQMPCHLVSMLMLHPLLIWTYFFLFLISYCPLEG